MPVWKTAFLVLLLVFSRFASAEEDADAPEQHDAEEDADAPEQHDDEEAAMDEPPTDDEQQEPEDGMSGGPKITREQLHKLHAKMDGDTNSKLSLDEVFQFLDETRKSAAVKRSKEDMESADANKDGKVSLDELMKDMYGGYENEVTDPKDTAALQQHKVNDAEKFKAADRDGDGLLDQLELAAFFNPEIQEDVMLISAQLALEERDHDKDGLLTFEELYERRSALETTHEQAEEDKLEPTPAEDDDAEQESLDREEFKKLDKDGSGKLDVKEVLTRESGHLYTMEALETFMKLADADSDHHVTIEELHAVHEKGQEALLDANFMEMVQHHEL